MSLLLLLLSMLLLLLVVVVGAVMLAVAVRVWPCCPSLMRSGWWAPPTCSWTS
jgi:hypothetical protein